VREENLEAYIADVGIPVNVSFLSSSSILVPYVYFLSIDAQRFAQMLDRDQVRIRVGPVSRLQDLDLFFAVFCS
jgi:hypothetical protein